MQYVNEPLCPPGRFGLLRCYVFCCYVFCCCVDMQGRFCYESSRFHSAAAPYSGFSIRSRRDAASKLREVCLARQRILSGMRPTGKLHLGNLQGALSNWIALQNSGRYDCFYFVADWHALTSDYAETGEIRANTVDLVVDWLSAGLDPA